MKRYSVKDLWNSLRSNQPPETSSGTNPSESSAVDAGNTTQSSEDPDTNVAAMLPSQPAGHLDSQVSDGDKAGATLLFSGIFLSLVGMTFTAMGWSPNEVSNSFEWTQLLGPILLSVGGTFILISICKFRMLFCQICKMQTEEGTAEIDMPPLSGPSFVFSGVNQPITFHRATVVQYIPPPYTSVVQDRGLGPIHSFQSIQRPLAVTRSMPPQYYSIYPMDNPAFSADNEPTAERRESRLLNQSGQMEDDKAQAADSSMSPPTYEELYPTCDSPFR